jgi:hypothetical protein
MSSIPPVTRRPHSDRHEPQSRPSEVNVRVGWWQLGIPIAAIAGVATVLILAANTASRFANPTAPNDAPARTFTAGPATAVALAEFEDNAASLPTPSYEQPLEQSDDATSTTAPIAIIGQDAVEPIRPLTVPQVRRAASKTLLPRTTVEVLTELVHVPEIDLRTFNVTPANFLLPAATGHPTLELFDSRRDLGQFPLVRGRACQLNPLGAQALRIASDQLRAALAPIAASGLAVVVPAVQNTVLDRPLTITSQAARIRPDLLVLMTGGEGDLVRQLVIEALSRAPGRATAQVLATRAVFDPAPNLRRQAARALKKRSAADVQQVLLAALQYPWPAVADHAADALAVTGDRTAVPELVRLLDAPDPARLSTGEDGTPQVREVVRINHLRNCQLCHAPSFNTSDTMRSEVPSTELPLPSPGSHTGSGYGNRASHGDTLLTPVSESVRADISYLRPDFSTLLPVENPGPWPVFQRFDFVVRTRPAKPGELAYPSVSYPQREAVLRALRTLTGADFGDRTEDWKAGLQNDPRFRNLKAETALNDSK